MKSQLLISPAAGSAVTLRQKFLAAYQSFGRKFQAVNADLLALYELFIRAGSGAAYYRGEEVTLNRGQVFTIKKRFQISRISVQRGSLWLTIPGEAQDILLQAGDKFELTDRWPVVVEALSDSEMICSA